jgi:hypothetical protein
MNEQMGWCWECQEPRPIGELRRMRMQKHDGVWEALYLCDRHEDWRREQP